jgi:hypothetical protein
MSTRPTNIIRHEHTRAFTVIANDVLNDDRLALDEKGLLCWYISLPSDWEVVPAHVRKKHKIGRDKYHRIMKSLRQAGYARLVVDRAEDGTIVCIRHVISDLPAIPASGDVPAIPDERVCEIEDAELEAADDQEDAQPCPENPDMDLTESAFSDSGKPVTRQSNKDLQNTPLPPKPEPTERPQAAIRELPSFTALASKWPEACVLSASAAERRFLRLTDDRKLAAFEGAPAYLAEMRQRGWKICDLQTYLRDRRWEHLKGAPAPAFAIHGGTPQAFRWLEYRRALGQPTSFMEDGWRQKRPWFAQTEWPPALPPKESTGPPDPTLLTPEDDQFIQKQVG